MQFFIAMCIDLYRDKILVYSDCLTPSPTSPTPSPTSPTSLTSPTSPTSPTPILVSTSVVAPSHSSPTPSPTSPTSPTPSLVSTSVVAPSHSNFSLLNYTPSSSNPSPVITPSITGIVNDLETPSATPIINTTMSPSSSNSSNMTLPYNGTSLAYIEDSTAALTIVIIVSSLVLILCIFACMQRCKKNKKVTPMQIKHKKPCTKKSCKCCLCCRSCEKAPQVPNKPPDITIKARTYVNQPPLPEESIYSFEGTPSAPAMSLPSTPMNKQ